MCKESKLEMKPAAGAHDTGALESAGHCLLHLDLCHCQPGGVLQHFLYGSPNKSQASNQ